MGDAVLPLLPSHCKAVLLAAASRLHLLTDAVLLLFVDQGQAALDLGRYQASQRVTDAGVRTALHAMPDLRFLDVTGLVVSGATLRALGECCPHLEVLRLRGHPGNALGVALKGILPGLEKQKELAVADSWEAAGEAQSSSGRLLSLQCICWPEMPQAVRQHVAAHAPAVAVNPTEEDVARLGLGEECRSCVPLSAGALQGIKIPGMSQGGSPEGSNGLQVAAPPALHIAERFRLAFVSREQRLRAQEERQWRQQRRREALRSSAAEREIQRWELELAL